MGENLIAVIDGVTAKGVRLWDGKESGRYAMEVLRSFLQRDDAADLDATALVAALDDELRAGS